jgi:hypothetical protein
VSESHFDLSLFLNHAYSWSFRRKWAATSIVSAFTFISPVSSSMIAPASRQLAGDFGITNDVVIALTTSVFVLAYAIGPLFLGPMSELYGRSRVLQGANMWYLSEPHILTKPKLLNNDNFPQSGILRAVSHRTRGKLLLSASLQDWAVARLLR